MSPLDKPLFRSAPLWHVVVTIVFIVILATGYIPQIARMTRPDAVGRDSMWMHGWYAPDYHVYLSVITLGQHGYPMYRNSYTTEKLNPLPYNYYLLAFGWITGPFHIWPPYVYHLAKLMALVAYVGSVYYLALVILKKHWRAGLATILSLVTTTLPEYFYNQHIAATFMHWWEDLTASLRLDVKPHHALAQSLMILSIAWFIRARQTNKRTFAAGAGFTAALSALMVPHTILPFFFIVGLSCAIQSITQIRKRAFIPAVTSAWAPMIICLPAVCTIWLFRQYAMLDPIWLMNRDLEVGMWHRDPSFWYHHYITFLPLIIPSVITWIWAIRNKHTNLIYMAGWTALPLLLYPFTDLIHFSRGRLVTLIIEIPLAISATYAIVFILPKYIPRLILTVVTVAFIFYSSVMIGLQNQVLWNKAMREYTWYSPIYAPNAYVESFNEIGKLVPPDSHVLTGNVLGDLLPAFLPVITYVSDTGQTYKWDEKRILAGLFYSGTMTDNEARQFLAKNGITFVVDDDESDSESHVMMYSFLKPVWHNTLVTLYKVE